MVEDTRDILRRTLYEGITPVVYHMASLDALAAIIKTGKIMTSVAFGTPADAMANKGRLYYLSTMRSPQSYYRRGTDIEQTLITLDGRKLGQTYKASPVDYWGPEFRKADPSAHEMEDRIFTDKPYIPNAFKYITAVRVVINPKSFYGVRKASLTRLFSIERKLRAKGIPFEIFTDERRFRTIPAKGLTVDEFLRVAKEGDSLKSPDPDYARLRRKYPDKPSDSIVAFAEIIRAVERGKTAKSLSKNARYYADRLRGYGDEHHFWQAEIHNAKAKPIARPFVSEIGRAMRKAKTPDLKSFVRYLSRIHGS